MASEDENRNYEASCDGLVIRSLRWLARLKSLLNRMGWAGLGWAVNFQPNKSQFTIHFHCRSFVTFNEQCQSVIFGPMQGSLSDHFC